MDAPHLTSEVTPEPIEKPAGNRKLKFLALRIVIYIIAFYAIWCVALLFFQEKIIFPADMAPSPLPRLYDNHTTELVREIPDGKVVAWFVSALGKSKGKPAPLVVFFHGNAEIIDYSDVFVSGYRALGCHILLPEFRGYGRSGGSPSEPAIIDDAVYFLDEALKRPDVDKSRIIIHGKSIGGGVAAQVASRRKPSALILESTFTSLPAMAAKYYAPGFLVRTKFNTDEVLRTLDVPLLLSHGDCDNIIPVAHARQLRDIARNVEYHEYQCSHNDFPGDGNDNDYWARIEKFLTQHGIIPAKVELSGT